MQKFNEMLAVVIADLEKRWQNALEKEIFTITPFADGLIVSFAGGRKQQIFVKRTDGSYILTSNVLHRARVEELGHWEVLLALWMRNHTSNLVGFRLDKSGKAIGYVEHKAESLDPHDLAYTIEVLARECDRLEFVLSGVDVH
jgi:hypothetical protein